MLGRVTSCISHDITTRSQERNLVKVSHPSFYAFLEYLQGNFLQIFQKRIENFFPVISTSLSPFSYLRFLPLQTCTCVFRTCVFHPCISVLEFSILSFSTLATSYLGFPYFRIPSLLLMFSVLAFSVPPFQALAARITRRPHFGGDGGVGISTGGGGVRRRRQAKGTILYTKFCFVTSLPCGPVLTWIIL